MIPKLTFAAGGEGATCNPATSLWPGCKLADIPIRKNITKTIRIPAGSYVTPYIADQENTEYVLDGNISADTTAITIKANYVIINLNGYTVVYNQKAPGEGVNLGAWNKHHIAIVNGSILQGAAMSEGNQYGQGNNPVTTYNSSTGTNYSVDNLHIANLYVRYGGRDVGGIVCSGSNGVYEQNTIEDTYEFGTLKNRHQGIDALTGCKNATSGGNIFRNNTVVRARHRGIAIKNNDRVYGNKISIRSIGTNSYGISGYAATNCTVHGNTIIARGEHPIGIGFISAGTNNIFIYDNYIDAQTTAIGEEYAGSPSCFNPATPCGNFAVGFRTTWGGNNIKFYNNEIQITTDSSYSGTYSVDGRAVKVNGKGRGLMVGISAGETATFSNNIISVLDKDGTGLAYGMACTYNFSDGLFFIGNKVTSNIANMVLGDEYGACEGFPLVKGNTFVRYGNSAKYTTLSNQLGGYANTTGRIVDNIYQDGASLDAINFNPSGNPGTVSVYFGTFQDGKYNYHYRLHDNNGASSVLLREDYDPPLQLNYKIPETAPSLSAPAAPKNLRVE